VHKFIFSTENNAGSQSYIHIYTIATSNSLMNITLGLYVLSTILNGTNVVL
jgi:hypothetical protein